MVDLFQVYHYISIMVHNGIKLLLLPILVSLVVLITGCCIPSSQVQRGNLSEAMEKASDDHKGKRKVKDTRVTDDEDDDDYNVRSTCILGGNDDDNEYDRSGSSGVSCIDQECLPGCFSNVLPFHYYLGLKVSTGLMYSQHYSNISGASLVWANHGVKKRRHQIELGTAIIPTTEESDLYGSIGDIYLFHTGYQYRRYSTPDFTFMGLFLLLGIDVKLLTWHYNNPIYSYVRDEYGNYITTEEITGDGVFGAAPQIGLGWSLLQTRHLKISSALVGGASLYWFNTTQAFDNDIFRADAYLKLDLDCIFKF